MMTDDKIEQLLAADHSEPDHNLTRRIHQGIIREVYMRALLVVLVSALMLVGGIGIRRLIRERQAFHLADWKTIVAAEQSPKETEVRNAQAYISAYVSIFYPGFVPAFDTLMPEDADPEAYGVYHIGGRLVSWADISTGNLPLKSDDYAAFEIRSGQVIADPADNILNSGSIYVENELARDLYPGLKDGDFYSWFRDTPAAALQQANITEIEKLPDSAVICLDIRLKEEISLYELIRFGGTLDDAMILYAVTDYTASAEYPEAAIGFSMIGGNGPSAYLEEYQDLVMEDTLKRSMSLYRQGVFTYSTRHSWITSPKTAADAYERQYIAQLRLLLEGRMLSGQEKQQAETALQKAEENGTTVIGYRILLSQDAALQLLQNESVIRSHIQNVRISRICY